MLFCLFNTRFLSNRSSGTVPNGPSIKVIILPSRMMKRELSTRATFGGWPVPEAESIFPHYFFSTLLELASVWLIVGICITVILVAGLHLI